MNLAARPRAIGSLFLVVTSTLFRPGQAWYQCGNELNATEDEPWFCPDGNKCCRGSLGAEGSSSWGCISGENANEGECCQDDPSTGCREGYACTLDGYCMNVQNVTTKKNSPLTPPRLPRYKLCSIHHSYQRLPNYLPSGAAFLSSHRISPEGLRQVEQLWVIVHGSDHNPDDYLCCTLAVSGASQKIWIIAPWFLPDGSRTPGLQWVEKGPISHTWRYGANAISSNVSSYAVVDDIITLALAHVPLLDKIIVAGHSAGGQYVQRWALLTNAWTEQPAMRAIVANPKSFCWLDARRILPNGLFQRPSQASVDSCPSYNEWEWGFESSSNQHRLGGALYTPYKDAALLAAGGLSSIVDRYNNNSRDIVYLAGELDVEPNDNCEGKLQGDHRRQRSENFFKSLQAIYGGTVPLRHRRSVVKGAHHDHCLIFQSPEGRQAFFGSTNSSVM